MIANLQRAVRRQSTLGLSLALLAVVAIDVTAYWTAVQYTQSIKVVNRSYRILETLQGLMADLVSAESEARGYSITGGDEFLVLHDGAVQEVQQGIRDIQEMMRDPENRENLAKLERLCLARLDRIENTIETRRREGFEAVRLSTGPGKALMDESRQVAAQIELRQRELLAGRDRSAFSLSRRTQTVAVVGSVFAIGLLVATTTMLDQQMNRRDRLEREVLAISEREQRRIGQDLHDGVCQQLTGISLLSRSLNQRLTGPPASEVAQITRLINESIEQARQVTRGLLPVPDEPTGLMQALKELAESVSEVGKMDCSFACPHPVPIPERAVATNLYRIAQEATQNALRHSAAKRIQIKLVRDESNIRLIITDDGGGLPREKPTTGMGLEIMAYRARSIGGSLELGRGEQNGTVVTCKLPLDLLI